MVGRSAGLALATASGLLGAIAFPDPGLWPLCFFAWAPLLVAVRGANRRWGALLGLLAGVTFFAITLRWLAAMTPVGFALLVVYLACYFAIFGALAAALSGGATMLAIPLAWAGIEWLRGWLFTGFGWNGIGYALAGQPRLVQAAVLGGVPLISGAIMASNVGLAEAWRAARSTEWRRSVVSLAIACGFPALLALYGTISLRSPAAPRHLRIAVVGGGIDPNAKWSSQGPVLSLERYAELTDRAASTHPDLVVWPETAIPQPLREERIAIIGPFLRDHVRQWGTSLLLGVPEIANEPEKTYWNGAALLAANGGFAPPYRKRRLVPFGEYVPFRRWLGSLPRIVPGYDYVPGEGGEPFRVGDARVGVLICFEDVFPHEAIERAGQADLLASLSNDAWFPAAGKKQHLQMSVLRAVETRRAVARAANGGISALIDSRGRVLAADATGAGVAVGELALEATRTPFSRAPDAFPIAALVATAVGLAAARRARARAR